jgi:hypothetical protein
MNVSIEGSNPSFSASAAPSAVLRPPAEGWQSGRMRRSRKPLSVVRRIEGSNPSPSAPHAESDGGNRVVGADARARVCPRECTGTSRDSLTRPRTGARPARVGYTKGDRIRVGCSGRRTVSVWLSPASGAKPSPGIDSFQRDAGSPGSLRDRSSASALVSASTAMEWAIPQRTRRHMFFAHAGGYGVSFSRGLRRFVCDSAIW